MEENIIMNDFELVFHEDNALICFISRAIVEDGADAHFKNQNLIIERKHGMNIELANITSVDKLKLEEAKIVILNRTAGDSNKQVLINIKKQNS